MKLNKLAQEQRTEAMITSPRIAMIDAEVGRQALPASFGTAPIRRRQQDYLSGQYSNLYNQYRGNLARQMTTPGIRPSEFSSFADFLRDIPMATRYSQMTPSQRGVGTSKFAPRTRQIFF